MMPNGRFPALLLAALLLAGSLWVRPAVSEQAGAAADGPGRGDLAGFVATPQTDAGGNGAFLLAPNGAWFLATSPRASTARLIDITSGITLRYLTAPGLDIVALTISHDSTTVFARDYNGQIIAWDAATGQLVKTSPPTDFHDITRLSLRYEDSHEPSRPTPEFLARYHLQSHFPHLEKDESITLNPTQEYAIIGHVGHRRWNAFQIWNLKKEKTELFFRLDEDICGYSPFSFDYDGKHLVFGNTQGESVSNHLDFISFQIENFGAASGPTAEASRPLAHRCRFPPGFGFGFQPEFNISPNGQLLIKGPGMPGTPEWAAWDLRNGKKVASIHPGGNGTVSTDGSTFVVLHDQEGYDSQPNRLTVQRYGKRKTFKIPRSLQSAGLLVHVSSNGRWIALRLGEIIAVWSAKDGKVVKEYRLGGDHPAMMLQVTDKGYPLLVDDKDGAAFVGGRWRTARTAEHGLIVPLTPNFHAQCGSIFCDRVVADLGVVERQPRNDRARNVARADLSPDGRFMMVRTLDKGDNVGHDVIDIADGHIVLHLQNLDWNQYLTRSFAWNSRFLVVREIGPNGNNSFVKYDFATGKRIWTAIPNRVEDGFYTMFPDGRVRYSKAGSLDVVLVRGFEVKHFYGAAAKQFVAPPDENK